MHPEGLAERSEASTISFDVNLDQIDFIIPEIVLICVLSYWAIYTSVELNTVLAVIYSTFVRYIILIAKNMYSIIRNAISESLLYLHFAGRVQSLRNSLRKPTTHYVSN